MVLLFHYPSCQYSYKSHDHLSLLDHPTSPVRMAEITTDEEVGECLCCSAVVRPNVNAAFAISAAADDKDDSTLTIMAATSFVD